MIDKQASSTIYYLADSVFFVDSIIISNFNHLSFIGQGPDVTILEGIDTSKIEDTSNWSKKCFDLVNADNLVVKDLQIRRFRRFGLKAGSTSSNFLGHNLYIDSCGWTAEIGEVLLFPSAVKLFGDNGHLGQTQIMESGWDGMQVAGYNVLFDSSTIYWTGKDIPAADHQGDGIQVFKNPDISYTVNNVMIWKSGRLIVKNCTINTVEQKKSGIEAGYIAPNVEKPLVQAYDSYIAGGKGIGITQSNDLISGEFYTDIRRCTIVNLDFLRYPIRVENYDSGTPGKIKDNLCLCPANYPDGQCPAGECNTLPNSVDYDHNKWKIGDAFQVEFCSEEILDCTTED
jgi:hypothetical protein